MVDNHDVSAYLRQWVIAQKNPPSIAHVILSALTAVLSYLIARMFHLQEAYWAPMTTLLVLQLTLSAAFPIAAQYILGTAVGAIVGAVSDIYFHGSVAAFGAAIVLMGLLCVALRVERSAFRYASITLAIVMLVPRSTSARLVALHRFLEVSIGIGVGLVLFAVWQKIDAKLPAKMARAPLVR